MFLTRKIGFKLQAPFLQANMSSTKSKLDPRTEEFKKQVTPWEYWDQSKRNGFRLIDFSKMSSAGVLKMLQTPIDLRPEKLSSWWKRRVASRIIKQQSFIPERHEALGSDISAGHALLDIGANVLYKGKPWMSLSTKTNTLKLPSHFEEGWVMEAIDVSGCPIYYEGLFNIQKLNNVHTFLAKNCSNFDNWFLDHLSSELLGLKNLDLSGCERLTPGGLSAVVRLPNLQMLNLSNIPAFQTSDGVLACLLLKECNPNLKIEGVKYDFKDLSAEDASHIEKELSRTDT